MSDKKKREKTPFEPGQPPGRGLNARASAERGLRWDRRRGCYVDDDGCPIRDRFGQPLG